MSKFYCSLFCLILIACTPEKEDAGTSEKLVPDTETESEQPQEIVDSPSLVILGTIQDAGSPHINCHKACCEALHTHPDPDKKVVSLGFIDPENKKKYLFEATPDISSQIALLSNFEDFSETDIPDGVFLTHAHIGHYAGLMFFGKEATNTQNVPVFAMPKMRDFLSNNGPWNQLISEENILLSPLENESPTIVNSNLTVIPFTVPHRDEYSETVGYKIIGPNKSAIFIPDIDKWEKWRKNILEEINEVDYAFLDATFYDANEIPDREISEIPHPLVSESMELFAQLSDENKDKIYFIHFNHSNPILDNSSGKNEVIEAAGFHNALINQVFKM